MGGGEKRDNIAHAFLHVKQENHLIEISNYNPNSYICELGNQSATSFLWIYIYFYAALGCFTSVLKCFLPQLTIDIF